MQIRGERYFLKHCKKRVAVLFYAKYEVAVLWRIVAPHSANNQKKTLPFS